jgi:hypothetical protein
VIGVFGAGAALPLLVLGAVSREFMLRWRERLLQAGQSGKLMLGGLLFITGVAILTGFDKSLEAFLVDVSPPWLTRVTTQF